MNFDYSLCKPNVLNDTKCAAFQNAPSSNSSNKKHPLLKSSSIELEQSRQVCGSSKRYLQSLGIWHLDLARAWAEASFKCSFLTTYTQLGQSSETRQKLDSKNSWNWRVILVPATVTKFKCVAIFGNGNQVNLLKLASEFRKIHEIISIKWIYFWQVSAVWNQVQRGRGRAQRREQGVQTDLKSLCNVSGWGLNF